jgi:hypothetical protein
MPCSPRSGRSWQVSRRRYHEGVRRYFTSRCIALHVTLLVVLPAFAWLTKWQLSRAIGGNTLSWAYTFEWPLFAGYAIYVWWNLVHDSVNSVTPRWPGARGEHDAASPAEPSDGSMAVGGRSKPPYLEPGWALTGGRERNVAIAAATAVDSDRGTRGERFAEQTPEEAAQLAAYNRYLAELAEADKAEADEEVEAHEAKARRR